MNVSSAQTLANMLRNILPVFYCFSFAIFSNMRKGKCLMVINYSARCSHANFLSSGNILDKVVESRGRRCWEGRTYICNTANVTRGNSRVPATCFLSRVSVKNPFRRAPEGRQPPTLVASRNPYFWRVRWSTYLVLAASSLDLLSVALTLREYEKFHHQLDTDKARIETDTLSSGSNFGFAVQLRADSLQVRTNLIDNNVNIRQ